MPGILISEMENVDYEFVADEDNPSGVPSLREQVRLKYKNLMGNTKKNSDKTQEKRNQTSVEVTPGKNGNKVTKKSTNENNNSIQETEEYDGTFLDNEIVGDDSEILDQTWEKDQIDSGIDPSDIKDGKEHNIPDVPDNPKENPEEATKNTNKKGKKEGEHCSTDEDPPFDGMKDDNGTDETKEETEEEKCDFPTDELNDFQKEVLWTAIDMLYWQPTDDSSVGKRKWEHMSIHDAKYKNNDYPKSKIFDAHSDVKGIAPFWRLKKFYHYMNSDDIPAAPISKKQEVAWKKTPWCAETMSVLFVTAISNLKVTHTDKNLSGVGSESRLGKYKNKPTIVPFLKDNQSRLVNLRNAKTFKYNVSWEPTIGSMFFVSNSRKKCRKCSNPCGHAGVVVGITKDKDIITIEGNTSDDYRINVHKRNKYYGGLWKHAFPNPQTSKNAKQNDCGVENKPWDGVRPPWPSDQKSPNENSHWHFIFVNPTISKNVVWTEKPSYDGDPREVINKMLNGFYNPGGSKGANLDNKTD